METVKQTAVVPITLTSEINDFAATLSYSGQYISQVILSTGTYTLEDVTTAYNYFLEDANLKEKTLQRPQIIFGKTALGQGIYKSDLTFVSLANVEGVNAGLALGFTTAMVQGWRTELRTIAIRHILRAWQNWLHISYTFHLVFKDNNF